jgi:hypothetical protein
MHLHCFILRFVTAMRKAAASAAKWCVNVSATAPGTRQNIPRYNHKRHKQLAVPAISTDKIIHFLLNSRGFGSFYGTAFFFLLKLLLHFNECDAMRC